MIPVKYIALGGVAVVGVYLLWKAKDKLTAPGGLADSIAAPIANTVLAATLPGPISVRASVRLTDGRVIPIDALTAAGETLANGEFNYQKTRYRLGARGSDNVYTSTRVQ